MQIKEERLRFLIRQTLLSERDTSFRQRGGRISDSRAKKCPFQVKIPAMFLELFSSKNIGDLRSKMLAKLPTAGIVSNKMDSTIAELDRILPSLIGYIDTYAYTTGVSCFGYYIVYKALQIIEGFFVMLGALKPIKRITNDQALDGSAGVDFNLAIKRRSSELASSGRNHGFVNSSPFYSLPTLSEDGADADNVDKLKGDLDFNDRMISNINTARSDTESRLFKEITEILDISNINEIKNAQFPDTKLSLAQIDRYKKTAINGIKVNLYEAMRSYTDPLTNNAAFKNEYEIFQRRHSWLFTYLNNLIEFDGNLSED